MIPTIQNPTYKCSICGKEEEQKGVVSTGIPEYWACHECRSKMKKITITRTVYEDGFMEVSGECTVCNQYPCRHGNLDGEFVNVVTGKPLKIPLARYSPRLRKGWLMTKP